MNELTLNTLNQRLERLEQENRRWKSAVIISLLFIGSVVLMAQAPRKYRTIEAERFVVKDPNGRVRAVLGDTTPPRIKESQYGLFVYGKDGELNARLITLDMTGGSLLMLENERDSWTVLSSSDSSGGLMINSGGAHLSLDVGSRIRFRPGSAPKIESVSKAIPSLEMWLDNKKRTEFGINPDDGSAKLIVYDKDGLLRAALGSTSLEAGATGSVEKRPESSLVLFDKDRKVIWKAP